jgi:predicted TIM-barrel fold metal-dependent hydrolase
MPIDFADLPLIDHHCHGLVPHDLSRKRFELMISESFADAPAGTSHFDTPLGLAIRAKCAPILDLEPFPDPDAYIERRAGLGAAEVNRRFVQAANCSLLLIDTGFRSTDILNPPQMTEAIGVPTREVVRIEAIAERVGSSGVGAAEFSRAFADELAATSKSAVGLKSIIAYRGGFDFDPAPPGKSEVAAAAGKWLPEIRTGRARMEEPTLLRHGLWIGAELAQQRKLPIQFHVGFGDRDAIIHKNNPSLLMPFLQSLNDMGVNVSLLHCFPFHRVAGYLAEVFPNVYFDVGVTLHYAGPSAGKILGEALEIAPFTKQLYSSDAFGVAEFYYLGAMLFRTGLRRQLGQWISDGFCNVREAERIAGLIAGGNARRIYPLE